MWAPRGLSKAGWRTDVAFLDAVERRVQLTVMHNAARAASDNEGREQSPSS